jgi:hypothetical protein
VLLRVELTSGYGEAHNIKYSTSVVPSDIIKGGGTGGGSCKR